MSITPKKKIESNGSKKNQLMLSLISGIPKKLIGKIRVLYFSKFQISPFSNYLNNSLEITIF